MVDFVAILNVSFRRDGSSGDAGDVAQRLRALPEIATVRVDQVGLSAVYTLDVSADDAPAAAARAALVADEVASACGLAHEACAIDVNVEDGTHEYTGTTSVYRVHLRADADGRLDLDGARSGDATAADPPAP